MLILSRILTKPGDMKKIYISVINDIITDERVNKITRTLLKAETKIVLIGRKLQKTYPSPSEAFKIYRFRLLFKKGPLFYTFFNIRLFVFLLFKNPDILVANDLDTLLPNYLVSRIKKIPLVYDSHEYFTEVPELQERPFVKNIWKAIEKRILPHLSYSMTVSNPIATIYGEEYNIPMEVIRNLPPYIKPEIIQKAKKESFTKDSKTIVYRGSLNKGRGLEYMIHAMDYLPGYKLIIVGDGDITAELKKMAQKGKHPGQIVFTGRVPYQDLFQYTVNANIGISIEENLGLNYRYALPNKLFNYIQSRIPVLVSDLPEMAALVNEYKIGEVIKNHDSIHIAHKIEEITKKQENQHYTENLEQAARIFCWENEEPQVQKLYKKLGLNFS